MHGKSRVVEVPPVNRYEARADTGISTIRIGLDPYKARAVNTAYQYALQTKCKTWVVDLRTNRVVFRKERQGPKLKVMRGVA